jgi:propionate CoA-transferase
VKKITFYRGVDTMSKVITADQAAALIPDGATVAASAQGLTGWAEEVAIAIEKRFLETGTPRNLTLVHGAGIGDWKSKGAHHLGHEGLLTKWMGGHTGSAPNVAQLIMENKCEAYCLPQGVVVQLYREIAAKRPGIITKVGLGTFVDPRLEGGKLNTMTKKDYVKVVEFDGEEWLYFKSFPIHVALIRGTTADENGNITMDKDGVLMEALPVAQAAKNSGGIVIAQVEYLAKANSLHPKHVKVPGVLVDYVVVAKPENQWQTQGTYYNPAFSGDMKVNFASVPGLPLDDRLIIARRAAMELKPNAVVNLGIGMPEGVAAVAREEGISDLMTLTTEVGSIGGVPANKLNFGHAYNSEAIIEHQAQFDWYAGGGLDIAFLGLAQTDKDGNVNVSKFKGRAMGCGGFIEVTQNAKKTVYCGTFMAKGLCVGVKDSKLIIEQEGTGKKFIEQVEQVTFSGKYAQQVKKPVLYITERAVFALEEGKVTLIEIAPGIDLEKDVLALMDFKPRISSQLKMMPAEIFQAKWGGLKKIVEAKVQ